MKEKAIKVFSFLKKKYEKYSKSFLYALLINCLILYFYLHFFYPYYESNDDFSLKAIVSGLYGFNESHMVYMNIILGWLFKTLYSAGMGLPWYDYVQYGLNLLSMSVITYVLFNRKKHSVLFYAAIFVAGYSLYVRPQYSKMASLLAIAGILLLKHSCDRKSYAQKCVAVFLLVAGSWVRDKQFFPCALICFGILMPDLLGIFRRFDSRQHKHARDLLIWGIISLALIASSLLVDKLAYRSELWSYYSDFNEARTELFDYGFPDFESNKEVYQKLNIDEKTLYMYEETWNFDDPKKLSLENLDILIQAKKKDVSIHKIVDPALFTLKSFFTDRNTLIYVLLNISACVLVFLTASKKEKLTAAFVSFCFISCVVLTSYLRPYVVLNRVCHGFLFALLFSILYLYGENEVTKKKILYAEFALLVLVPVFLLMQQGNLRSWNEDSSLKQYEARLQIAEEIREDDEHIYLFDTIANVLPLKKVFNYLEPGLLANRTTLGGWGTNSSWNKAIKEKYGIMNPFKDCINNDKVIFVSNQIEPIMEYINKYYDEKATAILLKEDDSLHYYAIVSK